MQDCRRPGAHGVPTSLVLTGGGHRQIEKIRIDEKVVNGPDKSACQGLIDRVARQGSQQEDSLKTYITPPQLYL